MPATVNRYTPSVPATSAARVTVRDHASSSSASRIASSRSACASRSAASAARSNPLYAAHSSSDGWNVGTSGSSSATASNTRSAYTRRMSRTCAPYWIGENTPGSGFVRRYSSSAAMRNSRQSAASSTAIDPSISGGSAPACSPHCGHSSVAARGHSQPSPRARRRSSSDGRGSVTTSSGSQVADLVLEVHTELLLGRVDLPGDPLGRPHAVGGLVLAQHLPCDRDLVHFRRAVGETHHACAVNHGEERHLVR